MLSIMLQYFKSNLEDTIDFERGYFGIFLINLKIRVSFRINWWWFEWWIHNHLQPGWSDFWRNQRQFFEEASPTPHVLTSLRSAEFSLLISIKLMTSFYPSNYYKRGKFNQLFQLLYLLFNFLIAEFLLSMMQWNCAHLILHFKNL